MTRSSDQAGPPRSWINSRTGPAAIAYYPAGIDDIGAMALEIARQIRNQYTIGYAPLNQAARRDVSHDSRRRCQGRNTCRSGPGTGYLATPLPQSDRGR